MELHEQVAAAFSTTGWTIAELLEKSGLDMDRSQLGRKLSGKTPMRTSEVQRLADVLEITLIYKPSSKKTDAAA